MPTPTEKKSLRGIVPLARPGSKEHFMHHAAMVAHHYGRVHDGEHGFGPNPMENTDWHMSKMMHHMDQIRYHHPIGAGITDQEERDDHEQNMMHSIGEGGATDHEKIYSSMKKAADKANTPR